MKLPKKELDQWLNEVDYSEMFSSDYVPGEFALTFMNFIKLVNGGEGEENETPPVHLMMLDKVDSRSKYIANLCFRGMAKTTLFIEYLALYIAVFGCLPHLGDVPLAIYVTDSMDNGVKSAKNNIEHRYNKSDYMKFWVPHAKFTEGKLEFVNRDGHKFCLKMYGAKTGIRGTKEYGQRPVLAVLDDLIGDETANSDLSMDKIKDTVYKGVMPALHPSRYKIIFNGTPFNKEDIIVKAIESGGWDVNVWPVCEKFPCTREEFRGAWPSRFSYEAVKEKYDLMVSDGHLPAFNQEMMLRITSGEDRLVQDSEIKWYSRTNLLRNRHQYNWYITTDVATSEKRKANRSVISVWAYSANGDWFWVDGVCHRKTIDHTWNELFRLVSEYKPQGVGIEVTGQQNTFIKYLQGEMMNRNIWFNFLSSEKSNEPGIRPHTNKLVRFNVVVPWFKSGKMHFPEELKHEVIMGEWLGEVSLITVQGFKGKDDFTDTVSMLGCITPWKPSDNSANVPPSEGMWRPPEVPEESAMSSYIV